MVFAMRAIRRGHNFHILVSLKGADMHEHSAAGAGKEPGVSAAAGRHLARLGCGSVRAEPDYAQPFSCCAARKIFPPLCLSGAGRAGGKPAAGRAGELSRRADSDSAGARADIRRSIRRVAPVGAETAEASLRSGGRKAAAADCKLQCNGASDDAARGAVFGKYSSSCRRKLHPGRSD